MAQRPTLCRGVLYRGRTGEDRAAMITKVKEGSDEVTLSVFGNEDDEVAVLRVAGVPQHKVEAPEGAVGIPGNTWRFPRRVG